jgi:hypothetical protein
MEETPQTTPEIVSEQGTSQNGQATEVRQPNDEQSFHADYTRKYQALADERRAFESERAKFLAQAQNPYTPPQAQPTAQVDPLIDQFGTEGAQAVKQYIGSAAQNVYQQMFQMEYAREDERGRQKYGSEWSKFDYTDPLTGQRMNQVMDLRCKGLSLDQAWSAMNPVDVKSIEQKALDKAYAEMSKKAAATPTPANSTSPSGNTPNRPLTMAEAFAAAKSEHGG